MSQRTVVVTGAASGMGRACARRLAETGHRVVTVDRVDADVVADLADPAGRRHAVGAVLQAVDGVLDGVVTAAGMGPTPGQEDRLIEVNYRGTVDLVTGWYGALTARGGGKVVVFGSNSAATTPLVSTGLVNRITAGDRAGVRRRLRTLGPGAPAVAYAASKLALAQWVRRTATAPEWAGSGVRLNAIAPGVIATPLLEGQLAGRFGRQVRSFPVPVGGFGDPEQIAEWVLLMLSPAADFMAGSVVVVDGGTEAYLRPSAWPARLPGRRLPGYLRSVLAHTPPTGVTDR